MQDYSRHLRDCFGCFTTGITIATTLTPDGQLAGVTINSFSSVSLDPPLVLFSLDNNASLLSAFNASCYFAFSILSEKQRTVSHNFSLSGHHKWANVPSSPGVRTGAPIIGGSIAYFECEKEAMHAAGDHHIFIGRVLECNKLSDDNPLLYYKGRYRTIGATL